MWHLLVLTQKNLFLRMSNNRGLLVIQLILSKIVDKDNDAVTENLAKLPLSVLSQNDSDLLTATFLKQAAEHANNEAARTIISAFDLARIRIDPLPAITQLFLNTSLSREALVFTINCFPEKNPIDFYVDLVNMSGDLLALKAAGVINTVFPEMKSEDWITLLNLTNNDPDEDDEDGYPNQMLRAFFQTKVAETGATAARPSWIIDHPQEELEPVPDNIPSVKEGVELLLDDLVRRNVSIVATEGTEKDEHVDIRHGNEVKETLISQYAISTIMERIQLLSPIRQIPLFNDSPLFREFGPVNTIYTLSSNTIDLNHPCSKHGGCRMLICTEFEQMYSDGDDIDVMAIYDHIANIDWFRKSCDVCLTTIPYRHYAIRQPLRHGGWRGCFCSMDCMKTDVTDPNIAIMIGRMQEQLDVIGIRHR